MLLGFLEGFKYGGLINALKYLAEHKPIDNFEEIRIRNSPIELPSGLSNF